MAVPTRPTAHSCFMSPSRNVPRRMKAIVSIRLRALERVDDQMVERGLRGLHPQSELLLQRGFKGGTVAAAVRAPVHLGIERARQSRLVDDWPAHLTREDRSERRQGNAADIEHAGADLEG